MFIVVGLSYLFGSISFSFLLTRLSTGLDVRYLGSGNIGAANVFRVTRLSLGLVVLVLDAMKGALAVTLSAEIDNHEATAGGAFAVVSPASTLVAFLCFIGTVAVTRFVSLGSMMATLALALMLGINGESTNVIIAGFSVSALIVFRHRGNIGRLASGNERRLISRMPIGRRNVI